MSIRKRTWTTNGVERSAWQADYTDGQGKRRRKNFKLKKEAEAFAAKATVEVQDGIHVPDGATHRQGSGQAVAQVWRSGGP